MRALWIKSGVTVYNILLEQSRDKLPDRPLTFREMQEKLFPGMTELTSEQKAEVAKHYQAQKKPKITVSAPTGEELEKWINIVLSDPTATYQNKPLGDDLGKIREFFSDQNGGEKILKVDGVFLKLLYKFWDAIQQNQISPETIRNNLKLVKEHERSLLSRGLERDDEGNVHELSVEHVIALVGGSKNADMFTDAEELYTVIEEEVIDGVTYQLVKALSALGIKKLANRGSNSWCINSISYAQSYFSATQQSGKGFWFILGNGIPLYAIGGADGISNVINGSLSHSTYMIYDVEYQLLQKWQPIFNYPLKPQKTFSKTDLEQLIYSKLEQKKPLGTLDIVYGLSFKLFDARKAAENILSKPRYVEKSGLSDEFTAADRLVVLAKLGLNGPFERKWGLDDPLVQKIRKVISSEFDASMDYIIKVYKYFSAGIEIYFKDLIETIVDQDDELDEDEEDGGEEGEEEDAGEGEEEEEEEGEEDGGGDDEEDIPASLEELITLWEFLDRSEAQQTRAAWLLE